MLRRSQSATNRNLLTQALNSRHHRSTTAKPKRLPAFENTSETCQRDASEKQFKHKHGYPPHFEQTEAFGHLINGRTTILLAGTGFGKSRVPEMFFHAYDNENYSPIVLCINPLVSLGNDQVSEKEKVGLKAVNLTGPNCTKETCDAILQGKYNFVYVSPEIALTSDIFDQMWRDPRFQARLILKVVDEAHMVYEWGLVESGHAKRLASHTRVQDVGVFRPSYGDLLRRFLATDKVPLLLMTATCTPQAIEAILANLKLDLADVGVCRAELTRPELRFIRRTFKRPLASSLRSVFAHHTVTPTNSIPPTLLYSGTQNATLDFLKLINCSRGQPNETANGLSDFARRYHASTGEKAKASAVEAFVTGCLAVLCCTLALGLGQNWHRVRRVVVLGRQDPCNFIQMSGRCGRDGRRGLGLLLVEHKRLHGKNLISDFKSPTSMTDDDRMDALAITPVCLRVALAVDLKHGYIPLEQGALVVKQEEARQVAAGMRPCDCSNCQPAEAEALWLAQGALTNDIFDEALSMSETGLYDLIKNLPDAPPSACANPQLFAFTCGPDDSIRHCNVMKNLVTCLETDFATLFSTTFTGPSDLGPSDYFGNDLAWDVAKNIDLVSQMDDFGIILTSEAIPGQFERLFNGYQQWLIECDTAPALAEAIKRRKTSCRNHGPAKAPQSVEGAEMAKARHESEKLIAKAAQEAAKAAADAAKALRARERERKAHEKLAEKAAREQAKVQAQAQRQLKKAKSKKGESQSQPAGLNESKSEASASDKAPNPKRPRKTASLSTSKRPASLSLADCSPKRTCSLQDVTPPEPQESPRSATTTTHSPLPNENGKIDQH